MNKNNKKPMHGYKRDFENYPVCGDIIRLGLTSVDGTNGKFARIMDIDYLSDSGAYLDRYTVELMEKRGYDNWIDVTRDMFTFVKRPLVKIRLSIWFDEIPF